MEFLLETRVLAAVGRKACLVVEGKTIEREEFVPKTMRCTSRS
jgi:hypothetical protein